MDEPIPFYPDLRCHAAPLRPGEAPEAGCRCRICTWARARARLDSLTEDHRPVRPDHPAWKALLEAFA